MVLPSSTFLERHRGMARKKTLRTRRNAVSLQGAVVAGSARVRPIVYGYTFASRPDRIKIGYSSRGVERIKEQTTGFPEPPRVLFVIRSRDAAAIEKRMHASLAGKQARDTVGVEWFEASFDDVVRVSPELRRALGVQRWRSVARWFVVLLGVLCGGVLGPLLSDAIRAPDVVAQGIGGYLSALARWDAASWEWAWMRQIQTWSGQGTWSARGASVGPALLAAWVVFFKGR